MSSLLGRSFIGGERASESVLSFHAQNPKAGSALDPAYHSCSPEEVDRASRLAWSAFEAHSPTKRVELLRTIAKGLEAEAGSIVDRAGLETGLPEPRLRSELSRTTAQLKLFADVVAEGSWRDPRIDRGDPNRKPLPKPDVRSYRVALGPVAVFGASNFPLAFSVAGGDTASALAAGNPVVVKAHPAHPGTSELVGAVLVEAVGSLGLHPGTFALLFDAGVDVGLALVGHPLIRAVGFTGSRVGGEALMKRTLARDRPIPVYAEMGSVNPIVILRKALEERGREIADGLHASFTLGVGQFCTNPGIVFVPEGRLAEPFRERLAGLTRGTPAGVMLTSRHRDAYEAGLERLRRLGASVIAEGQMGEGSGALGRATVLEVGVDRLLSESGLSEEVFGPSTLLVRYRDESELSRAIESLSGQLTATVHGSEGEAQGLIEALSSRAGRLVFNQFPTGVEVVHGMVHGGPFPATSDGRSTSVGTRSIERFTRLVAFQNAPQNALPEELRDPNPLGLVRLVDGVRSNEAF